MVYSGNSKDYWDYRGNHFVQYKGETVYTVTSLPYYCRRRSILLHELLHAQAFWPSFEEQNKQT